LPKKVYSHPSQVTILPCVSVDVSKCQTGTLTAENPQYGLIYGDCTSFLAGLLLTWLLADIFFCERVRIAYF
jgi:hypothetical protein